MDIKFYDFALNLLAILPKKASGIGYTSFNCSIDYNGIGSLEIDFISDKIKKLAELHKDDLIIICNEFEGYMTGYLFKDKICKILGKSLNGLLHKKVIPTFAVQTNDVETIARSVISANYDFLTLGTVKGFTNQKTYEKAEYTNGDDFIKNLLSLDGAGYKISANLSNKTFVFEVLKSDTNNLMLSESNLNAYDFEIIYDNKSKALGGWYSEKQPDDTNGNAVDNIWKYITSDNQKTGIYKEDVILKADNLTEATEELANYKAEHTVSAKTRKVKWKTDYNLGDIVRVQKDSETSNKCVTSITISIEAERIETPTLTEV